MSGKTKIIYNYGTIIENHDGINVNAPFQVFFGGKNQERNEREDKGSRTNHARQSKEDEKNEEAFLTLPAPETLYSLIDPQYEEMFTDFFNLNVRPHLLNKTDARTTTRMRFKFDRSKFRKGDVYALFKNILPVVKESIGKKGLAEFMAKNIENIGAKPSSIVRYI